MATTEVDFKCLRCGHRWEGPYDPDDPQERACSECGSNSVRPIARKTKRGK